MAYNWLRIAPEPGIEYRVSACNMQVDRDDSSELRFSIRIEDGYIHFEDMVHANCCADKIVLHMMAWSDYIDIYEIEYTTNPCRCMCDYPTTAVLGPFEPGTYTLTVSQSTADETYGIGTVEVVIP